MEKELEDGRELQDLNLGQELSDLAWNNEGKQETISSDYRYEEELAFWLQDDTEDQKIEENTTNQTIVVSTVALKKSESFGSLARFRQDAFASVSKARVSLSRTLSDVGAKIKYSMISKETEDVWKDILILFSEEFKDIKATKLDFLFGFLLLAKYYKYNVRRTNDFVTDKSLVLKSYHYLNLACAAYGWKAAYAWSRGGKAHFKGIAKKAQQGAEKLNMEVLLSRTGFKEEDLIDVKWKSEPFNPGHYIAIDNTNKQILVVIRGTAQAHDILTDLTGRNEEYLGGFVHSGMLKSARNKSQKFIPILRSLRQKYPNYKIKILGHSLGAGVAALLTIILLNEHPDWPVHCWCFASPCILSKALSVQYTDRITSFAYGNDFVARVSLGSMQALKHAIVQILAQSENNLQRMYLLLTSGDKMGDDTSKKISSFLKVQSGPDVSKVDTKMSKAEKLVPPGRIFHLYKTFPTDTVNPQIEIQQPKKAKNVPAPIYRIEESDHEFFTEIIISSDMYKNHLPVCYEDAWRKLLDYETIWKKEAEIS